MPELKTLQAIYLEAVIAPHMPQAMTITEFESLDHWRSVQRALASSASYQRGFLEWEAGAEPPYESYSERLLASRQTSIRGFPRMGTDRLTFSSTGCITRLHTGSCRL